MTDQASASEVPARAAADLAEISATFAAALRSAGLPVGPGRAERFAAAVTVARPGTPRALYLCALTTLVASKEHALILRAVFEQIFGDMADARPSAESGPDGIGGLPDWSSEHLLASAAKAAQQHTAAGQDARRDGDAESREMADDDAEPDREIEQPYLGTSIERLASKDFADLTDAELISVAILMRQITLALPERRSRRQRRRQGGRRTDMRATLRQARRTGGDAFRLIGRVPARRPRRLVVLCDISGSMEPYARAMIQLLYCAAGAAGAEVFTFATRLTRLTPVLARTLPGIALQRAGQAAPDWLGGTKIGSALKDFNDNYGRRGMARGAVVVIISDGWETGDLDQLRHEMERLSLVAFRIVWVNPRTKSAAYEPLAGGMSVAWPHCDAVVSAHTVSALDDLTTALADPVRRRAEVRATAQPVSA